MLTAETDYLSFVADVFNVSYEPPFLPEGTPADVRRIVADDEAWSDDWQRIKAARERIASGTHSQATREFIASYGDDDPDPDPADPLPAPARVNAFVGNVIRFDPWPRDAASSMQRLQAAMDLRAEAPEPAAAPRPPAALPGAQELPAIILDGLDGVLRTFVDHVTATARSPQPFLALGAALCAVGAAAGRRYRSETNIRTNPMVIALADSGGGKERPREFLADAFVQAGMTEYLGGSRIGSSAGLLTAVKDHPVVLFALDEIGHMLGINAGRNAGAHKAEILPLFTELWSKAGSQYFGTNYGDSKLMPKVVLHQPHVVLFGVTVPGVLWKAFGSGALSDGSLARFLVFQSPEDYPDTQRPKPLPMPDHITEALRQIAGRGDGNLEGIMPQMDATASQEARVVPCDAAADGLLDGLSAEELALKRRHHGTPQTAFWARLWEHTVRVAMIRAISRDHAAPMIAADDVRWAKALVLHCIGNVLAQVNDHVADTPWEASRKAVAAFLRDAGGAVSAMQLTRGIRQIDAKTRAQIIGDLIASGEVVVTAEQSGGRPSKAYTWIG